MKCNVCQRDLLSGEFALRYCLVESGGIVPDLNLELIRLDGEDSEEEKAIPRWLSCFPQDKAHVEGMTKSLASFSEKKIS